MDKCAQLGTTDLQISRHGFGAARIGDGAPLDQIEKLLGSLLDLGITFIDTADCYAQSEELIGRYLGGRSGQFVIATNCGSISARRALRARSAERFALSPTASSTIETKLISTRRKSKTFHESRR